MLAEYSSSINTEHERARACARTPKPEHHKKDRAPSEHRASMCSDPSLGLVNHTKISFSVFTRFGHTLIADDQALSSTWFVYVEVAIFQERSYVGKSYVVKRMHFLSLFNPKTAAKNLKEVELGFMILCGFMKL